MKPLLKEVTELAVIDPVGFLGNLFAVRWRKKIENIAPNVNADFAKMASILL
jgi:hypothetical protein